MSLGDWLPTFRNFASLHIQGSGLITLGDEGTTLLRNAGNGLPPTRRHITSPYSYRCENFKTWRPRTSGLSRYVEMLLLLDVSNVNIASIFKNNGSYNLRLLYSWLGRRCGFEISGSQQPSTRRYKPHQHQQCRNFTHETQSSPHGVINTQATKSVEARKILKLKAAWGGPHCHWFGSDEGTERSTKQHKANATAAHTRSKRRAVIREKWPRDCVETPPVCGPLKASA